VLEHNSQPVEGGGGGRGLCVAKLFEGKKQKIVKHCTFPPSVEVKNGT
jgi:hypothetical protein